MDHLADVEVAKTIKSIWPPRSASKFLTWVGDGLRGSGADVAPFVAHDHGDRRCDPPTNILQTSTGVFMLVAPRECRQIFSDSEPVVCLADRLKQTVELGGTNHIAIAAMSVTATWVARRSKR